MITTLTLNPALDKTLIVENLAIDRINRIKNISIDAGGKGINASKVIKSLGVNTMALGFLGGETGDKIISKLNEKLISHDFVRINEDTRTNTKLVDIINNTCTDLNESGPSIQENELKELYKKIEYYGKKSDFFILSGNVHKSIPATIYKSLIETLHRSNTKVILDASGVLLKEGIKAKPFMIKPNINELREIISKPLNNINEIINESKNIVKSGIKFVCVSMGEEGLLMVSDMEVILAKPPKVLAKSTVGAGDSVVGSFAVSFSKNEDLSEALKKACAVSVATVTLENTDVPNNELVLNFYNQITLLRGI